MLDLFLRVLLFDIIASFLIAKLEIQIEGKHGWAQNLPTWRVKNSFTRLFWKEQPYTGYHLWLSLTVLFFLHLPFFAFPWIWTIPYELFLFGNFFLAVLFEDFFWFILNPDFGIKKFDKTFIPWHHGWFLGIPYMYYYLSLFATIFICASFFLQQNTSLLAP